MSLGWVLDFYALSHERVSIVNLLLQTQPLFVLFFASLYVEELEHVSFGLIISTLLIVKGVMRARARITLVTPSDSNVGITRSYVLSEHV